MYAVILIEPARTEMGPPESELTVEQQINEVFLFETEEAADAWITLFQGDSGAPGFRFIIMQPSDPVGAIRGHV